jgi:hypothetical protein
VRIHSGKDLEGYFTSPHDRPARWLAVLTAYLDECGHEQKGWQFIAGFFGNDDQWKDFTPRWIEALGKRKRLHMHSLRWNHKKAERRVKPLLERLAPIPELCGLTPIVGGIRYGDYEDLLVGTPWEKVLSGYTHCLFALVMQTLRVVPPYERIEFVFEAQNTYEPYANAAFTKFLAVPDHPWKTTSDGLPKVAKWSFVPKGTTVLTDPADYAAFALHAVWTDKKSRKAQWCTPLLRSCDHNNRGIGSIMNRQAVRQVVTDTLHTEISRIVQNMREQFARGKGNGEKNI